MSKRMLAVFIVLVLTLSTFQIAFAQEEDSSFSCNIDILTQSANGWVHEEWHWSGNTQGLWVINSWGDNQDQGFKSESGSFSADHQYDVDASQDDTWTISLYREGLPPCSQFTVSWKPGAKPLTINRAVQIEFYDCVLSNAPLGLTQDMANQLYVNQRQNTGMIKVHDDGSLVIGPFSKSMIGSLQQLFWNGTDDGSAMFKLNSKGNCEYVTP